VRVDEEIGRFHAHSEWQSHYFDPTINRYFLRGIPFPEPGGKIEDYHHGEKICQVYMDYMAICPECGSVNHIENDSATYPTWRHHREIDEEEMWSDIDSKLSNPEFIFKTCENSERCKLDVEWLHKEAKERYFPKPIAPKVEVSQSVYVISLDKYVKIGIARDVASRLSGLQTSSPFPLTLLKTWTSENPKFAERQLHNKFSEYRCSGEWFKLPPETLEELLRTDDLQNLLN
jgi:hypothetical protein